MVSTWLRPLEKVTAESLISKEHCERCSLKKKKALMYKVCKQIKEVR